MTSFHPDEINPDFLCELLEQKKVEPPAEEETPVKKKKKACQLRFVSREVD
jgi:hypothetical protein